MPVWPDSNIAEDTSRTHCLVQEWDRAREIRVLNQNLDHIWDYDGCTDEACWSNPERGEDV